MKIGLQGAAVLLLVIIYRITQANFYPLGLFLSLFMMAAPWLNLKAAVHRWDIPLRCLFTAGILSNLLVIAANHGHMPVMEPNGIIPAVGLWKPATPGDHLLVLCDRIHVHGPLVSNTMSVGDLLIYFTPLLWVICWLVSPEQKRQERLS